MKYIDAIKGSLIALISFCILMIFIDGKGSAPIVETILTISSFLFAILAGFFISRLNDRYNEIRTLISDEDAYFFSLYQTAKMFGKKFANKIADDIDNYYINSFENDITSYYKKTIPYFKKIYETLYENKEKSNDSTFANLFSTLLSIELVRNKNSILGKERLTKSQWAVLLSLSAIILFCLFYVNTNQLYFDFLVIIISTILVLIILTIRDLQNLRLGGKLMPVLESGQEVLENMGKLRYYHQDLVKRQIMQVPAHVKKYRLGIHKLGEKLKVKIVEK